MELKRSRAYGITIGLPTGLVFYNTTVDLEDGVRGEEAVFIEEFFADPPCEWCDCTRVTSCEIDGQRYFACSRCKMLRLFRRTG